MGQSRLFAPNPVGNWVKEGFALTRLPTLNTSSPTKLPLPT